MNLVTATYGDGLMAAGRAERWTVVLRTTRTIWREIRKVRVEVGMTYGSETLSVMVG